MADPMSDDEVMQLAPQQAASGSAPMSDDEVMNYKPPQKASLQDTLKGNAMANEATNPTAALVGYGADMARQIPYLHEAASAIDATTKLTPGDTWKQRYDAAEQNQQAMAEGEQQVEPKVTIGGKTVLSPLGVGETGTLLASGAIAPTPEMAGASKLMRGVKAAGTGAGYGAVYGSDNADAFASDSNAAMQRLTGAGIGAGIGAAAGPAAEFAPGIAKAGYQKLTGKSVDSAAQNGRDLFVNALKEDGLTPQDVADRQEQLQQLSGEPVAALHAATENQAGIQTQGGTLLGVASKAARTPGEAPKLASQMVQEGANAPARVGKAFDNLLGENDYYGMASAAQDQKAQAGPLYGQAFAANQSMASPEIDRILATPAGKKALADARTFMQNERLNMGKSDPELTEQAADAGITTGKGVAPGLNMQTLDVVKKSLDAQTRAVKRQAAMGNATEYDWGQINSLSKQLRNEMDKLDTTATNGQPGAYAQARGQSAPGIHMQNALEDGENFLNKDPEEVEAFMKDPKNEDDTQAAYMVGARRAVQKNVRDPLKAADSMATQDVLDRVQHMADSPVAYQNFTQQMQHEQNMARNNAFLRTASNAGQQNTGKAMDTAAPQNVVQRAVNAVTNPMGAAANEGMSFLNNQWQKRAANMNGKTAAEFMRYATSKDPNLIRSLGTQGQPGAVAAKGVQNPSSAGDIAKRTATIGIPKITVNRFADYDTDPAHQPGAQARGGAIHMARGGPVMKRPKSYPAIEALRRGK